MREYIYLQVKDDGGNELDQLEWTWCQDRIEESDVEYINANLVQHLFDVLCSSEQTLRNLGMGELTGDARTIALNAASNIRDVFKTNRSN